MFNHIDWNGFVNLWEEFRTFLDTVFEWLMFVLADGPKPGEG